MDEILMQQPAPDPTAVSVEAKPADPTSRVTAIVAMVEVVTADGSRHLVTTTTNLSLQQTMTLVTEAGMTLVERVNEQAAVIEAINQAQERNGEAPSPEPKPARPSTTPTSRPPAEFS